MIDIKAGVHADTLWINDTDAGILYENIERRFSVYGDGNTNVVNMDYQPSGRKFSSVASNYSVNGNSYSTSDELVKALLDFKVGSLLTAKGGGGTVVVDPTWGSIKGDIKNQTDLNTILSDVDDRLLVLEGAEPINYLLLSSIDTFGAFWYYANYRLQVGTSNYHCTRQLIINPDRQIYVTKDDVILSGLRFVYFDKDYKGVSWEYSTTGIVTPPINAAYLGINFPNVNFPVSDFPRIKLYGLSDPPKDNFNDVDIQTKIPRGGIVYDSNSTIAIIGASFSSSNNGWFEMACAELGVNPMNKSISGDDIVKCATRYRNGTLWTPEEFETFDILVINQVWNYETYELIEHISPEDYNFADTLNPHAQAFDYIIWKYIQDCYAQRLVSGSKWYNTKYGKPMQILICTHWHDARTIFNSSIRKVCAKWRIPLVTFDENIGFTKNEPFPDGTQVSIIHSNNGSNTETIDGVVYGWHPAPGTTQYIQKKMAKIFVSHVK